MSFWGRFGLSLALGWMTIALADTGAIDQEAWDSQWIWWVGVAAFVFGERRDSD